MSEAVDVIARSRILLLGLDQAVLAPVRAALGARELSVRQAGAIDAAIELAGRARATRTSYHLVVVDLPDGRPRSRALWLADLRQAMGAEVPVVVLTSARDVPDWGSGVAWLHRPVRPETLTLCLAAALEPRRDRESVSLAPSSAVPMAAANDAGVAVAPRTESPLPSGAEPAGELEVVDAATLDGIRQLQLPDRPCLLGGIIERYLANAEAVVGRLADAIHEADCDRVRTVAHGFKSACGNVGAHRVMDLCNRLEAAGVAADLTTAPALLDGLAAEIEHACRVLRDQPEAA